MSDAQFQAVAIAVPATIAAVSALIGNLQSKRIHRLVNSNLADVKADLALANTRIVELTTALVKG